MKSHEDLKIVPATREDATVLSEVARRTFYDAYKEGNTEENLRLYLDSNFTPSILVAEIQDPRKKFFLAMLGNTPCGYGAIREIPPPPCVTGPRPVELYKMYVDQRALGTGAGNSLMGACLARAYELNFRTVWLGVWEKASRARMFYKKWKFVDVGNSTYLVGNDIQPDIIMARDV